MEPEAGLQDWRQVDEGWAQEHHPYWYEDIKAGKIPAQRTPPPSEGRPAAQV